MNKRLALLGASGHGKVVAEAALMSGWSSITFFDDAWPALRDNGRWPVQGDAAVLISQLDEFDGVVVSIGNCAIRWEKFQQLVKAGARFATIVHPTAVLSSFATVGDGTVLLAGAIVNVDTKIGPAGIVNTGATVDHDCELGHSVHICPGAHLSGNVTVDACSWVGVGAAVKQGVTLGANVLVGAGAVVVNHVADGLTVMGNPARPKVS